jgi:hypothetical protein
MLKVIIAFDDQDEVLGSYFTACKDDILGFLTEQKDKGRQLEVVEIIHSKNCHTAYVDMRIAAYQNVPLLFIAYSHGLSHSLRCNSVSYIHSDNIKSLFNAWLYTNACSSAKELGVLFTGQQGVFIGFNEEVKAFKEESGMMQASIYCDNCGLKYAIAHLAATTTETYRAMKAYYSQVIYKWVDLEVDIFAIRQLRRTRDALTIHGDTNLKMEDYINKVSIPSV